jgi:transposase
MKHIAISLVIWSEETTKRVAKPITLNAVVRMPLESYARGKRTPTRLMERAKIILAAAQGKENVEIAENLGMSRYKVARWRDRFLRFGLAGIEKDATRPGRVPEISPERVKKIVEITTQETPPNATHWSSRELAKAVGLGASSILRIWRRHGLKPHLERGFKLSRDPQFVEKLEDVVGLYLNPPEHAVVLSADEKSQIQALDRTQPMLPFNANHCATRTHDDVRNGTTTLFAAMNAVGGRVIGKCMNRHRHQEWIEFLKLMDSEVPKRKTIHLIVDNYATHKHEKVKSWLKRHPRFVVHFTPTSASWVNVVERFFRDITDKRIRRAAFPSVRALVKAIEEYLDFHNLEPKPFIWTAKASDILEKVKRARRALGNKL